MNELQTFNFNNQPVRTIQLNNQPYFNLKDVCEILDIGNPSQLKTRLKQEGVITNEVGVKTGLKADGTPAIQKVKMTYIDESNLYKTIFQSRKEEAEQFTEWVTSEVLPTIRKHGAYATPETIEQMISNPDFAIQLLTQLKNEREKVSLLTATVKEYEPKASYYDKILKSKSLMNTTVIAQDYGMSAVAFNSKLHELRIQHKVGGQWILYSEHQGFGYVHSETFEFEGMDGNTRVKMTTKWTQKGRLFLYEKLKVNGILPTIEQN